MSLMRVPRPPRLLSSHDHVSPGSRYRGVWTDTLPSLLSRHTDVRRGRTEDRILDRIGPHPTAHNKLVEHVSTLPWTSHRSPASVARFLKEFRDSPQRSPRARFFVDKLCARAFLVVRGSFCRLAYWPQVGWEPGFSARFSVCGFVKDSQLNSGIFR